MKDIVKPAVILLIITAVAAALLGAVQAITAPAIEEQTAKTQAAAMQEVFADAESFNEVAGFEPTGKIVKAFEAVSGGNVAGYVINVQPDGFSGAVDTMVGISADGTITGVKVLKHSETPGLGAKATEPAFQDQFAGKKGPVAVTKDGGEINAITSATITSRAVSSGVNEAYDWFTANGGAN